MPPVRACGNPAHELLAHLKDAAEGARLHARKFSLQHLDVKPENLLIVGGRVKIGDFGLVSDIMDSATERRGSGEPRRRRQSYRGSCGLDARAGRPYALVRLPRTVRRPTRHPQRSIQSGDRLPGTADGGVAFSGREPEQLAAQHRSGSPRLTPLSPSRPTDYRSALAQGSPQADLPVAAI